MSIFFFFSLSHCLETVSVYFHYVIINFYWITFNVNLFICRCVVWTGDGRVFFYNPSARASVWDRPDELINRPDVTKMISNAPPVVLALKKETSESESDNAAKKSKSETTPEQSEYYCDRIA